MSYAQNWTLVSRLDSYLSQIICNMESGQFYNKTIFKIKHHDLIFVFGYIFAAIETERNTTQTHGRESALEKRKI